MPSFPAVAESSEEEPLKRRKRAAKAEESDGEDFQLSENDLSPQKSAVVNKVRGSDMGVKKKVERKSAPIPKK